MITALLSHDLFQTVLPLYTHTTSQDHKQGTLGEIGKSGSICSEKSVKHLASLTTDLEKQYHQINTGMRGCWPQDLLAWQGHNLERKQAGSPWEDCLTGSAQPAEEVGPPPGCWVQGTDRTQDADRHPHRPCFR